MPLSYADYDAMNQTVTQLKDMGEWDDDLNNAYAQAMSNIETKQPQLKWERVLQEGGTEEQDRRRLLNTGVTPATAPEWAAAHIQSLRSKGHEPTTNRQTAIFDLYKAMSGREDLTSKDAFQEVQKMERETRNDTIVGRFQNAGLTAMANFGETAYSVIGTVAPEYANELSEEYQTLLNPDVSSRSGAAGTVFAEIAKLMTFAKAGGPLGMAGIYGAQGAGGVRREVQELREEGDDVSGVRESVTAGAVGGVEAASGFVGGRIFQAMGKMMQGVTPAAVQALLAGEQTVVRGVIQQGLKFSGLAATEGLEEGATQIATNLIRQQGIDPEIAIAEGVLESAGMGALLSPFGAGAIQTAQIDPGVTDVTEATEAPTVPGLPTQTISAPETSAPPPPAEPMFFEGTAAEAAPAAAEVTPPPPVPAEVVAPRSPGKIKAVTGKMLQGAKGLKAGFDKGFTPISHRLMQISGPVYRRVKQYTFERHETEEALMREAKTNITATQKSFKRATPEDQALYLTGTQESIAQITDPTLREQAAIAAEREGRIGDTMEEAGVLKTRREDFAIARSVKDYEGLKAHLDQDVITSIEKEINYRAKQLNRSLTSAEKNESANAVLRGRPSDPAAHKSRHLRQRTIETVTPDLVKFYHTPAETAQQYIRDATKLTARAKMFGRSSEVDLDTSIGAMVQQEIEAGNIDTKSEAEVSQLIRSLIVGEDTGSNPIVSGMKQLGYLETLTNVSATITQLGDAAMTVKDYGIVNTAKAIGSVLGWKKANKVAMEDLGIHEHGAEWDNTGRLSWLLDKALKVHGFKMMDRFGKETRATAALIDLQKQAKKGITPEVRQRWIESKVFTEPELKQIMDDAAAGKRTDGVKLMLWLEMSRMQPIDMAEMSQWYLDSSNIGRLGLSLKTFAIKQFSKVRQDVFDAYKRGGPKSAGKELATLYLLWTAFAIPIDMLKDFLKGREIDPSQLPDRSLDAGIGMLGFNRYTGGKLMDGKLTAMVSYFTPPVLTAGERHLTRLQAENPGPGNEWIRYLPVPFLKEYLYYGTPYGSGWHKNQSSNEKRMKEALSDMAADGEIELARETLAMYNQSRREHFQSLQDEWVAGDREGKKPSRPRELNMRTVLKSVKE